MWKDYILNYLQGSIFLSYLAHNFSYNNLIMYLNIKKYTYDLWSNFFIPESPKLNNNVVTINKRQAEEVPVPKFRRVLPEHEGRYKITMPAGTTPKTQKILQQGIPTGTGSYILQSQCCLTTGCISYVFYIMYSVNCKIDHICSHIIEYGLCKK
jgi:hypothetical protein